MKLTGQFNANIFLGRCNFKYQKYASWNKNKVFKKETVAVPRLFIPGQDRSYFFPVYL